MVKSFSGKLSGLLVVLQYVEYLWENLFLGNKQHSSSPRGPFTRF